MQVAAPINDALALSEPEFFAVQLGPKLGGSKKGCIDNNLMALYQQPLVISQGGFEVRLLIENLVFVPDLIDAVKPLMFSRQPIKLCS